MYLRISHVHFDPERYDELVPIVEEVTARVQQLPGNQHVHQGVDRTTGGAVAVSLWHTEEHARFSREALGDAVERLQAIGVRLEPPQIYEVVD